LLARWIDNYRARRDLLQCAALDARFARDIGLTDADIAIECASPFWIAVPRVTHLQWQERARW